MDDRIDRLEREIDALRTEINELRTASPRDRDVARPPDEGGSKRTRRAMITGAAAAGAGAAASLLASQRAAALDPQDLDLGDVVQNTNAPTRATYNGGAAPRAGFEFAASNAPLAIPAGLLSPNAALLGYGGSAMQNGVEGVTQQPNGVGVFAHNYAGGGTALRAESVDGSAVRAEATGTNQNAFGVVGTSEAGSGVAGGSFSTDVESIGALYGLSFGGNALFALGAIYGARIRGATADLFLGPPITPGSKPAPPTRTDAHRAGEIDVDDNGDLWYCTADGTPGSWRKIVGAATAGALHFLTNLVRIYDSRASQPPATGPKTRINPGESRTIDCTLNSSGVPADATGVIATLTVADTTGRGNLAIYPDGQPAPTASSINYTPGVNIANTTIVGCGPGAKVSVACGGSTGCNFLIDIIGYFT